MGAIAGNKADRFDAIVVGGGHNGLVAAATLARTGNRVLVLEARASLGGPCGTFEFLPRYRCAVTNSPGSLEPRIVAELELARFGLRFVPIDPTVVHPFPSGCFIGWKERGLVAEQLDRFAPGEAARYFGLIARLETLGRHLGVSVYEPSPGLAEIASRLPADQESLFNRVFFGSIRQLLDEELRSDEAKALLTMLSLNATMTPPSAPGTAVGLMMRPLSIASSPPLAEDDPRRTALRGSTGLPVGGMGAIVDALEACCLAHGAVIETSAWVASVLHRDGRAVGVVTQDGRTYDAPVVVSAINPATLFATMLDDAAVGTELRASVSRTPMRGSAFKLVLALDGLPDYAGLPDDLPQAKAKGVQFRIAPSVDYIERAVGQCLAGETSSEPMMWGLIPSVTSPGLAPEGRHLMSVNVWHAPYRLRSGDWASERGAFAERCIDVLSGLMPRLRDHIVDVRAIDPVALEGEFGLVESNITHGDMLPGALFGARPHPAVRDYRTPLPGLYLSGAGTWPGGYVTGLPGFNAGQAVLADQATRTRAIA